MRIPSASFCQRSTILLSSSSESFEYMEKRSPELSRKYSPPRGVGAWNETERRRVKWPFAIAVHASEKLASKLARGE